MDLLFFSDVRCQLFPAANSRQLATTQAAPRTVFWQRVGICLCMLLPGCGTDDYETMTPFLTTATSNARVKASTIGNLQFVDAKLQPVTLAQFRGKKNVVLVITRGPLGSIAPDAKGKWVLNDICLYCAAQTSHLMRNHQQFRDRNTEVLVVFPIESISDSDKLASFEEAVRQMGGPEGEPAFGVLLDVELKAVDQLGIRQDLARPATYILDEQGHTRFAYIGQTIADRPAVQAILEQLDAMNGDQPPPSP